jgi:hypothetical protein
VLAVLGSSLCDAGESSDQARDISLGLEFRVIQRLDDDDELPGSCSIVPGDKARESSDTTSS